MRMHAEFMRQLEEEGWERIAASAEALRMIEKIEARALSAGDGK